MKLVFMSRMEVWDAVAVACWLHAAWQNGHLTQSSYPSASEEMAAIWIKRCSVILRSFAAQKGVTGTAAPVWVTNICLGSI